MRILKIAVLVIVGLVIVWIVLGVGLSWQFQKPGAIILKLVQTFYEIT